jgi:hypothetical protein
MLIEHRLFAPDRVVCHQRIGRCCTLVIVLGRQTSVLSNPRFSTSSTPTSASGAVHIPSSPPPCSRYTCRSLLLNTCTLTSSSPRLLHSSTPCRRQPSFPSASHHTLSVYHPHTTRKHICDGKRRVASLWMSICLKSRSSGTLQRHCLSMSLRHLRRTACCCQRCLRHYQSSG